MDYMNIHAPIYTEIIHRIKSETSESIPQCYYIVGRRGYGKTELLHNIERTLDQDDRYYPLYVDGLLSPSFSIEKAIEQYHQPKEHRLILLIDDMDTILNNMTRDVQFHIRSLLYKEGAPVIVGTGSGLSGDFTDYKAPFYDAFILYHLNELSNDASVNLFKIMRKKTCFSNEKTPTKIVLGLLNEIGKTPESCRLLSNVSSFKVERKKILSEALSPLSLYYRDKIMSLSFSQRKTLVFMLSKKHPVLLKDIREATGQTAGDISPQLKSLVLKGLVSTNRQGIKKTEYMVADKLMNSWYRNCVVNESD